MNRLFLGFLVAGTALGGSAYKNVELHTTPLKGRALAPGYFVQKAANSYTYVSTATSDQGSCIEPAVNYCKYQVPAENNIPGNGPYSASQLEDFGLRPQTSDQQIWVRSDQ